MKLLNKSDVFWKTITADSRLQDENTAVDKPKINYVIYYYLLLSIRQGWYK